MTFPEAIACIAQGKTVTCSGATYWLKHDSKNRPVLMGRFPGHPKDVRHIVFSSEHFDTNKTWELVAPAGETRWTYSELPRQ